jgi:hypothetical protein
MIHRGRSSGRFRTLNTSSLAGLACVAASASVPSHAAPTRGNGNPFAAFSGEWTLKGDKFQHVGDGKNLEILTIPNHHTKCAQVNTERSILCVVKAGDLNGHILWAYDNSRQRVHWLSHFGTERTGFGTGTFDEAANLRFRLSFTDEPEGSYREYRYEWVSPNEYTMVSRQYDAQGRATGNWYGGTFIRLPTAK